MGDYYYIKKEEARDQWDGFPEEVRGEVERHFASARDRGFEMEDEEYEWRRVGVAKNLMDAGNEGELSSISKTGLKNFPKFTDGVDWETYLRDFDELIEPTRPAHFRIRMLRQVMGTEAKQRLDAYLMPSMLYTDFNEYAKDATPILEPPGITRRDGKQYAAYKRMEKKEEHGSNAIEKRSHKL